MSLKSYCERQKKEYLLGEWDSGKNLPLTPDTIAHSSSVPVWWRCEKGHSWRTQVKSRATTMSGCPKCREERLEEKRNRQIDVFKTNLTEEDGGTA